MRLRLFDSVVAAVLLAGFVVSCVIPPPGQPGFYPAQSAGATPARSAPGSTASASTPTPAPSPVVQPPQPAPPPPLAQQPVAPPPPPPVVEPPPPVASLPPPVVASQPPAPPPLPVYVSVHVVQALIGVKSNNKPWDGPGSLPSEAIRGVEKALLSSGNVYGAVAVEIANIANAGFDSPDPFGTLQLFSSGQTIEADIPYVPDTFSPNWNGLALDRVRLDDPSLRIRVTLIDRDAINNDPIGTVELNRSDLVAALNEARIYPVPVYQQGNRQFLFVSISVMPAR